MNRRYMKLFFSAWVAVLVLATASSSRGAGGPTIGTDQLPPDYQILGPGGGESNPCSNGVNTSCPYCAGNNMCGCSLPIPGYELTATCDCGCSAGEATCTRNCRYSPVSS